MTNKTLVRIRVWVRAWIKIYMRTRNYYHQEDDSELKSPPGNITTSAVDVAQIPSIMELIDATRYSSMARLFRVTAYVLRFVDNLKKCVEKRDTTIGSFSSEEVDNAEQKWIKDMQFPMSLQANYAKVKRFLNLFEGKENIIRCHGRIQESPLPYGTKFSILYQVTTNRLDGIDCSIRSHEEVMHNGVRETLTQVRSKYWITKERQVVKKILSKCNICRRLEGPSYGNPEAPPLPEFRLSSDFAFSKVGVDYAGPMYVKGIYSQSKDVHKVYISLYTCSSSGALHLDLVPDISSKAFVRSLERFVGRRGIPSLIISDHGKHPRVQKLETILHPRTLNGNLLWKNPHGGEASTREWWEVSRDALRRYYAMLDSRTKNS